MLHSGNPAMLISSDKIPANADAEITSFASTCPSAVAVPMVAIAVCATVLIALIVVILELSHFVVEFDLSSHPFQILIYRNQGYFGFY